MATIYPYIGYENAKEALSYYEKVFGATIIQRLPVSKEQASSFGIPVEKADDATMHAMFSILGATIMASDSFGQPVNPSSISILIDLNSEDAQASKEADAFWEKLVASKEVKISANYEDQFWGGKMGSFTDKYGVNWMLHAQPYSKMGQ